MSAERDQKNTLKRKPKTALNFVADGSKLPPQALDLEEAVLGAIMIEKSAITSVVEILVPESFYKEAHAIIYKVIIDLFTNAEPIDILTVTAQLRKEGKLDIVGGAYYVTSLTNRVASAANIEYHARIISQKFLQRELIRISGEIQNDAFEDSADGFDVLDNAVKKLFEISQSTIKKSYVQINSVVKLALKDIEELKDTRGKFTGIPSGFTQLDKITSGFQKSDLIIVAARPGMGKTALALSIARNAVFEGTTNPRAVAIFSLEMSSKQMVSRLISSESEIPGSKIRTGNLEAHEWAQLNNKIARLSDAPIFIDDTPALTVLELRAKCRRLKQQNDLQLIVIDYLQLMRGDEANNKNGNREQEVSYISRSLKGLAKELDVPVIALSQLSRQTERRSATNKPQLSDLRESGSIEQDADMVLFIYRPEYYDITEWDTDQTPTAGQAEIMIKKNRHGELKDIRLRYIKDFTKFADLSHDFIVSENFDNSDLHQSQGIITKSSKINTDDEAGLNEEPPF